MTVIKGKDTNGNDVTLSNIDLSKGLIIEGIDPVQEWELKAIETNAVSTTTKFIGGRGKRG